MATAELTVREPGEAWHTWRCAYLGVWSATLAAAVLVASVPGASEGARAVLGARLRAATNPTPSLGLALALAGHNLSIAIWPLLLGPLEAQHSRTSRRAADALVAAALLASVVPVGAALGAYGTALLAYVPQVPLEWAAFSLGASGWMLQRRELASRRTALTLAVLVLLTVAGAAALETWCVPHK